MGEVELDDLKNEVRGLQDLVHANELSIVVLTEQLGIMRAERDAEKARSEDRFSQMQTLSGNLVKADERIAELAEFQKGAFAIVYAASAAGWCSAMDEILLKREFAALAGEEIRDPGPLLRAAQTDGEKLYSKWSEGE